MKYRESDSSTECDGPADTRWAKFWARHPSVKEFFAWCTRVGLGLVCAAGIGVFVVYGLGGLGGLFFAGFNVHLTGVRAGVVFAEAVTGAALLYVAYIAMGGAYLLGDIVLACVRPPQEDPLRDKPKRARKRREWDGNENS